MRLTRQAWTPAVIILLGITFTWDAFSEDDGSISRVRSRTSRVSAPPSAETTSAPRRTQSSGMQPRTPQKTFVRPRPQPQPRLTTGDEEQIDLSAEPAEDTEGPGKSPIATGSTTTPKIQHGVPTADPIFKVYFDLNLISRPGYQDFTFSNFHSFLLFEIVPTPDIQFSFHVSPQPEFFELDYNITPRVQLRLGKIWIPFDDMAPHNIFGGRVNVSRLAPGAAFLPDLWTDLGLGVKLLLVEKSNVTLTSHVYVVNGFHAGGTDPKNPTASTEAYPNFGDNTTADDNNKDKAIGTRFHFLINRKFGIGASYYTARWSGEARESERVNIFGFDGQIRLGNTELRAGSANMLVNLNGDTFTRGGLYGEIGQRFGRRDEWKALFRGGVLQLDDRVIDVNDQTIVGATLLWQPHLIQYSLEHSRDLRKIPGKRGYTYTAFRFVIAL